MHADSLIIGMGNPLRRDDGFGPAVLDLLEAEGLPGRLKLISVHQLSPEIAEDLRTVDRVVFVDARIGEEAGLRMTPLEADAIAGATLSHEFPPAALLHLTGALYGQTPRAWTLSAPALDLSPGEGLSPACQVYAEEAVLLLQDWLNSEGD